MAEVEHVLKKYFPMVWYHAGAECQRRAEEVPRKKNMTHRAARTLNELH